MPKFKKRKRRRCDESKSKKEENLIFEKVAVVTPDTMFIIHRCIADRAVFRLEDMSTLTLLGVLKQLPLDPNKISLASKREREAMKFVRTNSVADYSIHGPGGVVEGPISEIIYITDH
jgi:hypothetical protein